MFGKKKQQQPVMQLAVPELDEEPADAALLMQIGVDGVFVGSGIFKSGDPARRARAIVEATTHYNEPEIIAEVSKGLGEPMVGINVGSLAEGQLLAGRGW